MPLHPPSAPGVAYRRRIVVLLATLCAFAAFAITTGRAAAEGWGGLGIAVTMRSQPAGPAPFTLEFAASGGVPPYQWSIVDGALPAGLELLVDGTVTGMPIQSDDPATFTVRVVDAAQSVAQQRITLNAARWSPLPDGVMPDIDRLCAAGANLLRADLDRLCQRFTEPDTGALSRWIIGRTIARIATMTGGLWEP